MTAIIADSTCDLNPDLLKNYDLKILPLSITLQDKSYLDGIDINVEKIYDGLVNAKDKTKLYVKESSHVVTRDAARMQAFEAALEFIRRLERSFES